MNEMEKQQLEKLQSKVDEIEVDLRGDKDHKGVFETMRELKTLIKICIAVSLGSELLIDFDIAKFLSLFQ